MPNLRDVGGWACKAGGRVRYGALYRSTGLGKLADADLPALAALGLRTVFDLRTADERADQPDRVPSAAEHVVADVMADAPEAKPAQLMAALSDPDAAGEMLSDGQGEAIFQQAYRGFVALPSARAAYQRFFVELAAKRRRPALVHCTTGKDRTGWACAALLMLLGVSDEDVMREYLLTNEQLLPALQPVFDRFRSKGGDPQLLLPVLGVRAEYLSASLDEMHTRFGTVEQYFADGLGLGPDVQSSLRDALIEHG